MRIELDFTEQVVIIKEIEYYAELEKAMIRLFGEDRAFWKIKFDKVEVRKASKDYSWPDLTKRNPFTQPTTQPLLPQDPYPDTQWDLVTHPTTGDDYKLNTSIDNKIKENE